MTNKTEPMKANDMVTDDYDRSIHSSIDALITRLRYTHDHGLFDANEAGMLATPKEAADALEALYHHSDASAADLQAENTRLGERAARMNKALQEIEYLTTNAGGWFDQPGRQFAEYARLGDIAKSASSKENQDD